jgi:NAD(P)-dependent dehydrogenase (short-subunit alcohol dehydrogenase family)
MKGRVCLVTGATSGIGLHTAAALAERGARVLMAGIGAAECERALEHVRTEVPGADLHALPGDLSRISEVRRLAATVREQHPHLHVLVNNAGVYSSRHSLTEDGIERMLAVNYVAPFVLTTSLLPNLLASGGARVVNVSSAPHALTSNAVHPGVVGTALVRSAGMPGRLLGWARFLLRTPARGARTSIHLAASPEVEGVTGEYFVDARPARVSSRAADPELAERLWAETVALVDAR